mgnify:CR=1 FL=1
MIILVTFKTPIPESIIVKQGGTGYLESKILVFEVHTDDVFHYMVKGRSRFEKVWDHGIYTNFEYRKEI